MLATVVSKYLESNRRLVIPQLGAFLVKEPNHIVIFSQFLTKDDGVLLQILKENGASELEASGIISRLVFDVKDVVSNGGEYVIAGVGRFISSSQGSFSFEYDPSVQCASEEETSEEEMLDDEQEVVATPELPEAFDEALEEAEDEEPMPIAEEQPIRQGSLAMHVDYHESNGEHADESEILEPATSTDDEVVEPEPSQRRRKMPYGADPDLEGLNYGARRGSSSYKNPQNGGLDWWMIIAVAAMVLAISVILYGFLREGARSDYPMAASFESVAE